MADTSGRGGSRPLGTDDDRRDETDGTGPGAGRTTRKVVVSREKEEHGGLKIGCAFFGWLTATGMTVLLTALAAAAGAVFGLVSDTTPEQAANEATGSADTIGLIGGIVLLVIVFVAYYAGGYVAGRMARFNGLVQGLAVWGWAVVIAILIAVAAAVAGSQYDVLDQLNSFPRIPVSTSDLTTGGLIALGSVVAASLVGALLGGLAGMHFHRKVDQTGLGR